MLKPSSMPALKTKSRRRWFRSSLPPVGLGWRMASLATAGVLLLIGSFAFLGMASLRESTDAQLKDREVLAQNTARHVDYVLSNIESVITDPQARACWLTWEQAVSSAECAYHRLDFLASRVLLVDLSGEVAAAYPPLPAPASLADYASVQAVLNGKSFAVSRYYRQLGDQTASALAAAPVHDGNGQLRGALVIAIDLAGPGLRTFSNPLDLGQTGYMDLVDLGGTVMASTRAERLGLQSDHRQAIASMIQAHRQSVSTCHDCHEASTSTAAPVEREILAFAPLEQAPWGIAVRQNENEVLASTRMMQQRIIVLLAISFVAAILFIYLSTRSVLRPIQSLMAATARISSGDLSTPVRSERADELGALARSFDQMREQLQQSMAEVRTWNKELDTRVQERTVQCKAAAQEIGMLYEELREKEATRKGLLHRILSVQEDERKRISRELHDETCQILLTLAFGLENIGEMVSEGSPAPEILSQLDALRTLAKNGRDEVNRLIFDLRPMMLDHLGLVSALRWYAEMRLSGSSVEFTTHEVGAYLRAAPAIETTLFRVGQEAINNIAQHSHARHADITFEYSDGHIGICITDDGVGFNPAAASDRQGKHGLGLMGMEERVSSLGGDLTIDSAPGAGTAIRLRVPKNGNGAL